MASNPITSWQRDVKQWKQWESLFYWAPKSLQVAAAAMKLKDAFSLEKKPVTNLDNILKSRNITLPTKVHTVKAMVFSSSHVRMWEMDHKENWAPKNWCFWTVVTEKTLESPLHCKEIKPVNHKGNQSWIVIGKIDTEAEAPVLWPPDAKNWLIGKDPDAGKDWRQKEKGTTEDGWIASPTQWTWIWALDGWMASLTRWTWAWVNSGSWWWTGRPGVLWFMESQRVRHNRATELNWTETSIGWFLHEKNFSALFWVNNEHSC